MEETKHLKRGEQGKVYKIYRVDDGHSNGYWRNWNRLIHRRIQECEDMDMDVIDYMENDSGWIYKD